MGVAQPDSTCPVYFVGSSFKTDRFSAGIFCWYCPLWLALWPYMISSLGAPALSLRSAIGVCPTRNFPTFNCETGASHVIVVVLLWMEKHLTAFLPRGTGLQKFRPLAP